MQRPLTRPRHQRNALFPALCRASPIARSRNPDVTPVSFGSGIASVLWSYSSLASASVVSTSSLHRSHRGVLGNKPTRSVHPGSTAGTSLNWRMIWAHAMPELLRPKM
ncbi:hypothetical protein PG984_013488 [Apiospora sp. TS-2023a]